MKIDLREKLEEKLIPLTAVPDHVPGRPHISTVWRWVLRGVRGVRLSSTMVGGRRYVELASIRIFLDRCNATVAERDGRSTIDDRAAEQAREELDNEGIC